MKEMNYDIKELNLSQRSYKRLKNNFTTIKSLLDSIDEDDDLYPLGRIGRVHVNEIMVKLFLFTYKHLKPENRKAYLDMIRAIN